MELLRQVIADVGGMADMARNAESACTTVDDIQSDIGPLREDVASIRSMVEDIQSKVDRIYAEVSDTVPIEGVSLMISALNKQTVRHSDLLDKIALKVGATKKSKRKSRSRSDSY